jgi:hypothetical protein
MVDNCGAKLNHVVTQGGFGGRGEGGRGQIESQTRIHNPNFTSSSYPNNIFKFIITRPEQ